MRTSGDGAVSWVSEWLVVKLIGEGWGDLGRRDGNASRPS